MEPIKHTSPYLEPQDLLKAKDTIYLDDVRTEMLDIFRNGLEMGKTTYFKSIDKHFKWLKGEVTVMGGIANHGKSKLMKQMMLIKSVREGTKWGIFSPEENPPYFFYNDLIHTYIGKATSKHYRNQMSEAEYKVGMDFIKEHFFFIYPANDSPTPDYINERFLELMEKENIEGCLIDPFNQLDNDWRKDGGRDDQYISKFLSLEKRFAMRHNIYKIICAHPSNSLRRQADGNLPCPQIENLAGGMMWANKLDNVLATWRPYYTTDYENTETQFHSQKIKKQLLVGIPGSVSLTFDVATNRYLEDGKSPFDHLDQIKSNGDFFGSSNDLTSWK